MTTRFASFFSRVLPAWMAGTVALLLPHALLGAAGNWRPLWNGKNLDGWHIVGPGSWQIENGMLHATHSNQDFNHGILLTDDAYTDFTVRLQFKAVKGNSGLFFRADKASGRLGVAGMQAEIDTSEAIGGINENGGRKWIVEPTAEQVKTWFKPGEWNEMIVSAHGGHIVVQINGKKSAELFDDPGRRKGYFGLQLHGQNPSKEPLPAGTNVEVWFKDIEIMTP